MSTRFFSFSDDTPFSTEAVLVNASSSHYEEDWPSIPHTHAFTELFYVSEGSGEFLIENQHFSIKKDDLIIVNPHIQHTEISLSASPLSYYTVGVDVLLSLIFSCFHPFIQAKNAPSSSDIWIPTTAMTSIWNSLPA